MKSIRTKGLAVVTNRIVLTIAAILSFTMILTACDVMFIESVDGPRPAGQPFPPTPKPGGNINPSNDDEVPLPAPGANSEGSETSDEDARCMGHPLPPDSLPDADCITWSFLHSLVIRSSAMAGENPTDEGLMTLATDLYPHFIQAQVNCGEWLEPYNDFEPITDFLFFLTLFGTETYEYNTLSLLVHLLEGAANDEFALKSAEIGCVKSFFLLFVEYSE